MAIIYTFLIILAIVWIGAELSSRAGFMAEDRSILKEERERVKRQIQLADDAKKFKK
jgi:hypothetical protein